MMELLEGRIAPAALVAIDDLNHLLRFDSSSPGAIQSSVDVTGLQDDEIIAGIDFRPRDNQLYGLTSADRLYLINVDTGAATLVATLDADVTTAAIGLDFDPVSDQLRVVNDADGNFRIDPTTGAVTTEGSLAFHPSDINGGRNPTIVAVAYSSPDNDPQTWSGLLAIDSSLDMLLAQSPAADGTLRTIGSDTLGTGASSGVVGFDIGRDGRAFASVVTNAGATLYEIDLNSPVRTTALGAIGDGRVAVRNLAIIPSGFSAVRTGETATFTGTADADVLHLTATQDGLLRHNGFSKGSPGFESSTDFDSAAPGVQTLSATAGSTIVANLGGGDDVLRIGDPDSNTLILAPGRFSFSAHDVDALITFNGGAGDDQLIFDNSVDAGARTILIDDDQVLLTGVGASSNYHEVERVDVKADTGASTVNIASTAAGVATTVSARGSSAITINLVPGESDLATRLQGQLRFSSWGDGLIIPPMSPPRSGVWKIVADDTAAVGDHTYVLGRETFSRDGAVLFSHLDFDAITLVAGSGNDLINARDFPGYAIVDGGRGFDQIISAEARIDRQSLIYREFGGNQVMVTTSARGGFEHSDFDFAFSPNKRFPELRLINLSDDGADFQGASLTVSVVSEALGNGLAKIGYINATNVVLGIVKVAGNLGQIDAGDSNLATPGVSRLKVGSLGQLGLGAEGNGGELESEIIGGLDVLRVEGDIEKPIIVSGQIGRITVLGSLLPGTLAGGGSIQASGLISSAYFGGSLLGGSTRGSGSISATDLGSVFVAGNVISGVDGARNTGAINASGKIGKVTIKGDLVGGASFYSGSIFAQGDIGTIDALGNLTGGARIEGSIIGHDGSSGIVSIAGKISKVRVLGDVSGSALSPLSISAFGQPSPSTNLTIGLVDIRGTLANTRILAGHNVNDSDIPVNGDARIGAVRIGQNLMASDIVAGVDAGADGTFGTADDLAGISVSDAISRIGSIVINGRVNGTTELEDHFGFVAQLIASVVVQGVSVPMTPGASNDTSATDPSFQIAPTGDVRVKEV